MASRTRDARASKKSSAKKEATDKRFEALENKELGTVVMV